MDVFAGRLGLGAANIGLRRVFAVKFWLAAAPDARVTATEPGLKLYPVNDGTSV